ncbi:Protein GVQW1 [Plecturocebus cupreus]
MGFHYIVQAGLQLLTSGYIPAPASRNAGITGVSHLVHPGSRGFKDNLVVWGKPGLAVSLRLECSGAIMAHCSLDIPELKHEVTKIALHLCDLHSPNPQPQSTYQKSTRKGFQQSWDYRHMPPYPANFVFLVETGFYHVDQAGLELLISGDLPASASQSAGITGVSRHAWSKIHFIHIH